MPTYRVRTRPAGHPTRGKTATNRLRRLDAWLCMEAAGLLRRRGGPWDEAPLVDLGFGRDPRTTLEAAERLRRLRPGLPVVGVEYDRARVEAALPHAGDGISFLHGGFELGRILPRPARLVRAVNVLRQYPPSAVPDAWRLIGEGVLPGGLVVEGTSDPTGRLLVVYLLRRSATGLTPEGVLFSARLRAGFAPEDFQAVLPKALIHEVVPGTPVYGLLRDWSRAWLETSALVVFGPRVRFAEAARRLARGRGDVAWRPGMWRRGYLLWR